METCPKCGALLRCIKSENTIENEIEYINQTMVCANKNCENYAGENLDSPRIVVDINKNQVN